MGAKTSVETNINLNLTNKIYALEKSDKDWKRFEKLDITDDPNNNQDKVIILGSYESFDFIYITESINKENIINPYVIQGGLGLTYKKENSSIFEREGWINTKNISYVYLNSEEIEDIDNIPEVTEKTVFYISYKNYYKTNVGPIPLGINKDLTNITHDPKEYPYHLIHSFWNSNTKPIIESGKICSGGDCHTDFYDEDTGIYLYNTDIFPNGSRPGIYMELFEHSKIENFKEPMNMDSSFFHFRFFNVDSYANYVYGDVGLIFPFENIFGKYKVNIFKDEKFGWGDSITLDEYINIFPGEVVIRANTVPISLAVAMTIKFSFTELDFIYDKLGRDRGDTMYTLKDVINLYLRFKNKWYVRKSALYSVLQAYDIKSIRSPNLKKLLPVYAVTEGKGLDIDARGDPSIYQDPEQDIESDWDEYDPNEIDE